MALGTIKPTSKDPETINRFQTTPEPILTSFGPQTCSTLLWYL
jgi:hypothetical protein